MDVHDRRRFDPLSVIIGAAMVLLALSRLIGGEDAYLAQQRYVWPIALIGIGLTLLATRARRY